jgi:hypothetical protein
MTLITNDRPREERQRIVNGDFSRHLLHQRRPRIHSSVDIAPAGRRLPGVGLTRIDEKDLAGGRDVSCSAIGIGLNTRLHDTDHVVLVRVTCEPVLDEPRMELLEVVQRLAVISRPLVVPTPFCCRAVTPAPWSLQHDHDPQRLRLPRTQMPFPRACHRPMRAPTAGC